MKTRPEDRQSGPDALARFRKALKTIVAVPKSRVVAQEKALHKKRKPAKPKG